MMIILQWCLRQNIEQLKEQDLKILTPKQMLQKLLIALAKVRARNNSESLLNEIRQKKKKSMFCLSIKKNHQKSIQ